MITSVLSLILSFGLIQGATGINSVETEVLSADNSYAYESTLTLQPSYTTSFDYYTQVQLPQIQKQEKEEKERILLLRMQEEKARQDEQSRIEVERLRIESETAKVQAQLEAQKKAEEERKAREVAREKLAKEQQAAAVSTRVIIPENVDYVSLIRERCATLGCNSEQLIRVMYCESGGRHNAYNKSSGASGLFQHMPQYWDRRAAIAGVPGSSIWDPYAQIIVSTYMFADGQASHWECK